MKRIEHIIGRYAVFDKKTYEINRASNIEFLNKYSNFEWVLRGNNEEFPVNSKQIESAFYVRTIAEVDGYECQVVGVDEKGCFMGASEESAEHFGIDNISKGNPYFYRKEEEIENIWEERNPIEGFPFKTEKVVYLKMYGEWLDKED